jgi:glycosyltransferase involved in cell wall biosynthesis
MESDPLQLRPTADSFDDLEEHRVLDLSVILPTYNEGEAIEETVEELRRACPEVEIVVVDDGSTDGTSILLSKLEGIVALSHERNRGYGAAVKSGIRRSSKPYIAWYDADGQHRPEDLVAVCLPVMRGEKDAVVGVRGPESAHHPERVLGKLALKWVAELMTGQRIPDLNSGLRCFRRDVLVRYLHLLPDGFSASTTSTILALERGYRVGYVPITTRRRKGRSTVRIFADGLATLRLIVRLVVLFEAFKVFTLLGIGLIVPGLVYGLAVALVKGEGFPTLAGTAVIAGLLTFFMGIVADQVTELRKERFEEPPE